jgi:hypothetical protein
MFVIHYRMLVTLVKMIYANVPLVLVLFVGGTFVALCVTVTNIYSDRMISNKYILVKH